KFEARTRVAVNPRALPASDLFARMSNTEAPGDRAVAPCKTYDTSWRVEENAEEIREGQRLVAVAIDGGAPVGYASFGLNVVRRKEGSAIRYCLSLGYFYVLPAWRGRGVGVNLSAACAEICCDVLLACFLAARKGTTIDLEVHRDPAGRGLRISSGHEAPGRSLDFQPFLSHRAVPAHVVRRAFEDDG